jgi:hypothetical protein
MHDIFEQDLGGPMHEDESQCKAPSMTDAMQAIVNKAKAGDTCVVTAIMNMLAWAYATRFAPRGVDPENFLEFIAVTFKFNIERATAAEMLAACLAKRHHH